MTELLTTHDDCLFDNKIDSFSTAPNKKHCLFCSKQIPNHKHYNKFCDSSCAAKFNNPNRILIRKSTYLCEDCSCAITLQQNGVCSACKKRRRRIVSISNKSKKSSTLTEDLERLLAMFFGVELCEVGMSDLQDYANLVNEMYHFDHMSPVSIGKLVHPNHKNFAMFMKRNLFLTLRKRTESIALFNHKWYPLDERSKYYMESQFKFDVYSEPKIKGFSLLHFFKLSTTAGEANFEVLQRDHMVSRDFGFKNQIPAWMIGHPANCELITAEQNQRKATKCSITVQELENRIHNWTISAQFGLQYI